MPKHYWRVTVRRKEIMMLMGIGSRYLSWTGIGRQTARGMLTQNSRVSAKLKKTMRGSSRPMVKSRPLR
jgi:hypothetical protein